MKHYTIFLMNYFISWLLRHKLIRSLWQIIQYIATLPFFYIGYLFPQHPKIWVFSNTFGFKDNARYLFEYVQANHPEIIPVWITCHSQDHTNIGLCYSRFSIIGLWYQYRASISFVSTGLGDLARFSLARTKVIQLWHGIPIKNILLDSPETLPFGGKPGFTRNLSIKILKKNLSRYSMVIASSKSVQSRMINAFGISRKNVAITGYPRHDILFENSQTIKKRILYAPTWRSDIQKAYTIVKDIFSQKFVSAINEMGYELWISVHPLNYELKKMLMPETQPSVKFVDDRDINLILAHSEILITDYSSIAIDFAMLKRKTIFYTPDLKEYFSSRGIYLEFESLIVKHGVDNTDDILSLISNQSKNLPLICSKLFIQYHDAGARKRIIQRVKEMQ